MLICIHQNKNYTVRNMTCLSVNHQMLLYTGCIIDGYRGKDGFYYISLILILVGATTADKSSLLPLTHNVNSVVIYLQHCELSSCQLWKQFMFLQVSAYGIVYNFINVALIILL